MSPAELLLPETTDEVLPFSQRLVQRRLARSIDRIALERPQDRRAHARRPAADLEWLETVRLSGGTGYGVTLIDLSEGGALVEVDAPLRPGVRLTLELAGGGLDASVPLEVLRSYVARLKGDSTFYRGACAFSRAIDLPSARRPGAPARTPFVGAGAALQYLLERSDTRAGRVALARPDLLRVLESIHSRGDSGGAVGRGTLELLGAVLPAIHRGASREDAAAALERRYRTLPRELQADLRDAARTLETLIGRCFPDAPDEAASSTTVAAAVPSAPLPSAGQAGSAMQKIVVRYVDGDLMKGFTHDFHPSRSQFSLWPSVNAAPPERVVVPMSRLKAVFFVRDFEGNPGYRERKTFTVRSQGRRLEVTFADTEVILGTTLNYRPDGLGFFVAPADPGANNSRIFVVASAVKRVRFL